MNAKKKIWIAIIAIAVTQVLILVLMFCNSGLIKPNGWLDGWGSFLGALLGVSATLITFISLRKQNKKIYTQQREDQLDDTRKRLMPWLDVELIDKSSITSPQKQLYKNTRNTITPIIIGKKKLGLDQKVYIRIVNNGVGAAIIKSYNYYSNDNSTNGKIEHRQFLSVGSELIMTLIIRATSTVNIIITYDDLTDKEHISWVSLFRADNGEWFTAQKYDFDSQDIKIPNNKTSA